MPTRKQLKASTTVSRRESVAVTLDRVFDRLDQQDIVLQRVDEKLSAPVLNGGFESLMSKVDKIESIQDMMKQSREADAAKIDAIHLTVNNPESGLYAKVKGALAWISTANWVLKGAAGALGMASLAGLGDLLYAYFTGHLHYTP